MKRLRRIRKVLMTLAGATLLLAVATASFALAAREPAMHATDQPLLHPDGPTRYALFAAG